MMPGGVLSTKAVVSPSADPSKRPGDFLIDYERGGIGINDPSQGLRVQIWKLEVERDNANVNNWNFFISSPSTARTLLFTTTDVKEAALSFDQNMRPFVAYVQGTTTRIWWYDPSVPGQITTTLGTGYRSPRCTMDEKRDWHTSISDILLFYVRNGNLCERRQRDRFQNEIVHKVVGPNAELVSVAMGTNNRITIRIRNSNVSITDQQAKVEQYPYLSDIVQDLCMRAGIPAEYLDTNDLYGDTVVGYPITTSNDVAEYIEPLAKNFFFDPTEYDKRLRFLRRGRNSVGRFTYKDLVDQRGGKFKQTVVQEDKLPIRVEVSGLDPAGGFARNMQPAYRKSNLVKAKGVEEIDLPFAATADQLATVGLKWIKMKWHEQVTYEFWLPIAFTQFVPTDDVEYVDEEGNIYRIRIEARNEDSGILKFTGKKSGGNAVYGTNAKGLSLPPPVSSSPGLVGETRVEILNIPVQRDQDDELGVYVAVAGSSSAWYGADVLFSVDGLTYADAFSTEIPATLGDTETELLPEISAEYPSEQSVVVQSNYELESISRDSLMTGYNRCVIGDEVLQFQNAVHLGDNRYQLSGLVRGRYNTNPVGWPIGTRFVLIDTALTFLQAQSAYLGREIFLKPVSYGLTEDESVALSYDFDEALSQTEWEPYHVEGTRNGNSVTVSWIGRGRISSETSPRQSKYFAGYRAKFSDGVTMDTTTSSITRSNTPAGVTVQICGVNQITGEGPYTAPLGV